MGSPRRLDKADIVRDRAEVRKCPEPDIRPSFFATMEWNGNGRCLSVCPESS